MSAVSKPSLLSIRSFVLLLSIAALACTDATSERDESYPEDRYVEVNGARLHYLDWGGDGPTVLLVHGFTTTAHDFGTIAPAFARKYRVLAVTRRGHGSSDPAPDSFDVDLNVDDLATFIKTFSVGPVVAVGMSHGGMEITRLAHRYPELVRALVYLDGVFDWNSLAEFPPLPGFDLEPTYRSYEELDRSHATLFAEFWGEELRRRVHSQVLTRDDGQIAWQLSPTGRAYARYIELWGEWDPTDYEGITVPVLVFFGHRGDYWLDNLTRRNFSAEDIEMARIAKRYDEENKRRGLEILLTAVPSALVVELEATAHLVHFHRPAEVIHGTIDFLEEKLGSRAASGY